jgi:hypothetical protein
MKAKLSGHLQEESKMKAAIRAQSGLSDSNFRQNISLVIQARG